MMDFGDFETCVKVIVVGNGGVGKSTMSARYCKGVFTDSYKKTIGVDYLEKTVEAGDTGETVKLMVWDTAGQEEFDAITSSYYRGAGACAIVFSTIDRQSFEALDKWRRKVQDECGDGIVLTLVQNKIDLVKEAKMSEEEVAAVARRWGVPLFRTCVKDNTNVNELFTHMATQYIVSGGDTSGVAAMPALGSLAGQGGSAAPAVPAESEEAEEESEGSLTASGTASTGAASGGAGSAGNAGGKPRPGPLSASRSHDAPSEGKAPVTPRTPHSPREEKVITTEDEDVSPPAANARPAGDAGSAGANAAVGAPGTAASASGVSAGGGSSAASTGAAAGAKPAAAAGGAAGEAPLPMPPTSSGAFKLTAEPKINKKKKRGFGMC